MAFSILRKISQITGLSGKSGANFDGQKKDNTSHRFGYNVACHLERTALRKGYTV